MRLYYFTSEKYALANLENRRLKISFPDEVNDIFEMKPFDFGNSEHAGVIRHAWKESIDESAKTHGFISFTKHWSTPTMWAHYANNHLGVCYGFNVPSEGLDRIDYVDDLRPFNMQVFSDMKILKCEIDYAKKTKSSHWRYEKEWRQFVALDDENISLKEKGRAPFYVDFNEKLVIREVIIGAKSKITSAGIKRVLHPEDKVTIRTARASFRKYAIVEQKNCRLQK